MGRIIHDYSTCIVLRLAHNPYGSVKTLHPPLKPPIGALWKLVISSRRATFLYTGYGQKGGGSDNIYLPICIQIDTVDEFRKLNSIA